ncbi:probable peroxisomal acyl-coenzyme A oxidase 1 [Anastrepha obliqua]|uniref:probable peroxisomal acyl-coenzyme A oxidase 1 n=1 Tax=Anastrepha obliqua TaxID=95512 RepID=UPI002409700C|nr:probable peroxisomal acyl-coenzyme A oxidase 1 [Anastrepha obliqua]
MSIPKDINPDLAKERKSATFDVEEFSAWIYDSANLLQMKRLIEEELYKDLDDPIELDYLSYEDIYNRGLKHSVEAVKKLRALQDRLHPGGSEIYPTLMGGPVAMALMPAGTPLAVHVVMFTRALRGQGTPEQYEKFGRRADNCEIIGTYAQTELGHGTYLRGLETRADYDRQADEFVLNTPTLTSYKWWPGGLGQTVNYCIVVAQLYIDNEPLGVQLFVLQVRDEQTHAPLPGIDIGDIGKRIGMPGVNNGYLGLKNVRIPRTNMLMKNAKVLPDGTFVKSPVSQLTYFPMVYVRCMVVLSNCIFHAQAVTITTRYSAVRRQSPINPNLPEPQILDHLTQQMKVVPEIAAVITYRLAGGKLYKMYVQTAKAVNRGDYSRLPELHALACAMKASCTYDSAFGIERLRLSCGGHGYLASANLGNLFTWATAACTYEGENSVLYLQVGRILLKTWADVLAGKQLMPTMAYLSECARWSEFPHWSGDWMCLVQALQFAATNKTRIAYKNYNERLKRDLSPPEASNATGIELTQAAELHGRAFVANTFYEEVTGSSKAKRSASLNKLLEDLLELYLIHTVQRHMADILRFIRLTEDHLTSLQSRLETALAQLRPNLVAICDGFDFHDKVLSSVLGCYDGNVYERIFEAAKKSPLNKKVVPASFEQHLKPFMKSNL